MHRIVIIGNGPPATSLVEEMLARTSDFTFEVVSAQMAPNEIRWFTDLGADIRLAAHARRIDRFARKVVLSDGSLCMFHRLVLASPCEALAREARLERSGNRVLVNA